LTNSLTDGNLTQNITQKVLQNDNYSPQGYSALGQTLGESVLDPRHSGSSSGCDIESRRAVRATPVAPDEKEAVRIFSPTITVLGDIPPADRYQFFP
jgi:hypothetical protein